MIVVVCLVEGNTLDVRTVPRNILQVKSSMTDGGIMLVRNVFDCYHDPTGRFEKQEQYCL